MKKQIEKLAELSEEVKTYEQTRLSAKTDRRFGMEVQHQKWKVIGTRTRANRGESFHFNRTFFTKGCDVSTTG